MHTDYARATSEPPAKERPQNFVSSTQEANENTQNLVDRLRQMANRMCGVVPTEVRQGAVAGLNQPQPVRGVFEEVEYNAKAVTSALSDAHELLNRIEAMLP